MTNKKMLQLSAQPATFTQGQWYQHDSEFPKPMQVTHEGETWETSDAFICADRNGKKTLVALVKYSTSRSGFGTVDDLEEAKANARLIEHAKEAVELLEQAESFIAGFEDDADQEQSVNPLLGKMRRVLAKIRGEYV